MQLNADNLSPCIGFYMDIILPVFATLSLIALCVKYMKF